jgi:hypothetical protein
MYLILSLFLVFFVVILLFTSCANKMTKERKEKWLASAQPESDILGWGNLKWGMTLERLCRAFRTYPSNGEFYRKDGEENWFIFQSQKLKGTDGWTRSYCFDEPTSDGKLIKILSFGEFYNPKENTLFEDHLEYFTKKYGEPDWIQPQPLPKIITQYATWQKESGSLVIHKIAGEKKGSFHILFIAAGHEGSDASFFKNSE